MKALQVTLFIIANILFLGQFGRDLHHLVWGIETSVFDQFTPARTDARSEQSLQALLEDYRKANGEIEALEKGKSDDEIQQLRRDNKALYLKSSETHSEIAERERMSNELRDLWVYSGYGLFLIILGGITFSMGWTWVGMSLAISGFTILEYWACPPIFGGAYNEFRALLWSKTALTALAIVLVYVSGCVIGKSHRSPA